MDPRDSQTSSPPPEQVGPYRLVERLGAGGMGEVYRAWDERLERHLAIKHILPAKAEDEVARERLRREARAVAALNHPAIVHIYDIVESDEGDWIVMELVEGEPLSKRLRQGALEIARVLRLASDLAAGLAAAHGRGILHRDLKASNVVMTPGGGAKILDFGLAKRIQPDPWEATLSLENHILGTTYAMSPEQALGDSLGPRSDLFSLGSLIYEMLTGEPPFRGASSTESLTRVCTWEPPPVSEVRAEVPDGLSELLRRLMSKRPEDRPADASAVVTELDLLAGRSIVEEPEPTVSLGGRLLRAVQETPEPSADEGAEAAAGGSTVSQRLGDTRQLSGERRQITVLCYELTQSAEDGSGRTPDPETLFEVQPQLHSLVRETLKRFEGHLEPGGPGHRLLVYFGYPRAHEDDAWRAVRSALELVEGTARWARVEVGGTHRRLTGRAGIHTGPAVVTAGEDPRSDQVMLGTTLEVASGLVAAAPPGSVVCSSSTRRLVSRDLETEAMESVRIPGFAEAVPSHRVRGSISEETRSAELRYRAPLVARRQELDLLLDRWRLARGGRGQALLLSGDAGVGKSRLVAALKEELEPETATWWTAFGTPYTQGSPFHPVSELLRRELGIPASSDPSGRLEALEQALEEHALRPVDAVPLLAPLFGFDPDRERYPAPDLGPELLGRRTREVLADLPLARAEAGPLVLVVEDLHWIDPSTLDWIALLLERCAAAPILLLLTFRMGFSAPWGHRAHLTQIHLGPLSDPEAETLIELTAGSRETPEEVRRQIVERADGVPLYVEELTKAYLEAEASADTVSEGPVVPATLRDSLIARLDRLGAAKQIAHLAAVVGREFSPELLGHLSTLSKEVLEEGLDRLTKAEIVLPRGFGSTRRYLFKHALLRDSAYESLVPRERRRIHRAIAEVLANPTDDSGSARPELVAYHFAEAKVFPEASRFWLKAGRTAAARSATREAIDHLRRGVSATEEMPEGPERDRRELELLALLGPSLSVTRGYSAPEVERVYGRAHELCRTLGDTPQLFWILWGLWSYHLVRSEIPQALELALRLVELAEASFGEPHLVVALYTVGQAQYFHGALLEARETLLRATELEGAVDDPEKRLTSATGQDTGVAALACLSLVLWHLGEGDEAVERSETAIDLALRLGHPYSQVFAHVFAARLHQSRRDPERTRLHAEAVIEGSLERGFFWVTQGRFFLGCSRAEQYARSEPDPSLDTAAMEAFREGLDGYRSAGARLSLTYMLAQIAEHHRNAGRKEEAARCLEEAFAGLGGGERYWEPELHRLRGLLARTGESPDRRGAVERELQRSLDLARQRGDRALETRARADSGASDVDPASEVGPSRS